MAKTLTGDLKQISECWLYRDPRVSRRARLHTFCRECKDTSTITKDDSCPLCRPFFKIPEDGCGSIPRNYFMEKLVDLHEVHLEGKLNLKGDKIIDIPLVEEFEVKQDWRGLLAIAWLEDKLYVAFSGITKVHVFADQSPFEELDETIEVEDMKDPLSMTASAATRSIFIGEYERYIWKIQMPERELSRWEVDGYASGLSITPSGKLLAGVTPECIACLYDLNVFDLTNSSRKVITLPSEICAIISVIQTLNENFIINYIDSSPCHMNMVSILSTDGRNIIKTVGPGSIDLNYSIWGQCEYDFVVMDDGQILATECGAGVRVLMLNSDLTGCRVLSDNTQTYSGYTKMIYLQEKQRLFVQGRKRNASNVKTTFIFVYHLSPCYEAAQNPYEKIRTSPISC